MVNQQGPPGPHLPSRPLWHCRACSGVDWPCPPAVAEIALSWADAPISFSIFMAGQFVLALEDLSKLHASSPPDPRDLYERFMSIEVARTI
jgi:hypothetical protein